jgi:hypothetical protein
MRYRCIVLLVMLLVTGPGAMAQVDGEQAPAPSVPRPAGTASAGAVRPAGTSTGTAPARPATAAPRAATSATTAGQNPELNPAANCENGPCDATPAHISIATAAPAPAPWPWQDRIAWVANILLVLLGYAGIMIAISTLKKIAQQTHYVEAAAMAASESAKAALEHVQAIVRSERPWVLVTVEPSRKVENRFSIMATNRGKGPARILSSLEKITTEVEESRLPETPQLGDAKANAALASVILLPGESTGIGSFGRDEVKTFCETDEKLKRVENWEEMILLYGKILYQDLTATGSEQHETSWCFWYIHGRRNSGMVAAGSAAYHRHT